ncbi:MAG: 4-(cytidine 5'-diphospho)-2-C-methyl-D-erythritol kinase [Pseudomonadota bacterium]|nr:4-(cytidine 5'-diphospho)-2-C-methyl-D-erythritol kinase [Pseudomonadota bacterium]
MEIIEEAKSKINLSLNLTGKKENNFHQLLSFICFSNFSDHLILTKSDFFDYETHSPFQKIHRKDDLVLKTIDTIKKYLKLTDLPPFKLVLKKNIPLGSGLGGGSADSAALIRLLNNFLNLKLSTQDMITLGAEIGSDIPACIISKPLIAHGRGEKIIELNYKNTYDLLIIYPQINISTKEIFDSINTRDFSDKNLVEIKDWIESNSDINSDDFYKKFSNDLQNIAVKKYPVISDILDTLNKKDAIFSAMTGSGSACFGVFNQKEINLAANYFEKNFSDWIIKKTKLNDF